MGIRIGWSISLTYFISGILAGIAGMLIGPVFSSRVRWEPFGLKSLSPVIGGLGNVREPLQEASFSGWSKIIRRIYLFQL